MTQANFITKKSNKKSVLKFIFTFIMDFKGGTYISQVTATNLISACSSWAKSLDVNGIKYFGAKTKTELIKELKYEKPISIKNNINVFVVSVLLKGHFTTIHIIKTEKIL